MKQEGAVETRRYLVLYAGFCVLMLALGASDAMRGIMAPVFSQHFGLDASGLSVIVTASYVGNFVFLLVGGKMLDICSVKKAQLCFYVCWAGSLLLMALTDDFLCLTVGMAGAMGASTMLNTSMSLTVPSMKVKYPAFLVNALFFVQGIGTSGSQSLVGNWAQDFGDWHLVVLGMLAIGLFSLLGMLLGKYPPERKKEKGPLVVGIWWDFRFYHLILIFGFYFIAEHGMLNWFVSYAVNGFSTEKGTASNIAALFSAGIMIGRLVLSPLVDRMGIRWSITAAMVCTFAAYFIGVLLGESGLWILAGSGLFFSIIYPTMVMSIRYLWEPQIAGGISGKILSLASLADIGFNAVFGNILISIGYHFGFLLMPVSMGICLFLTVCFFWKNPISNIKNSL